MKITRCGTEEVSVVSGQTAPKAYDLGQNVYRDGFYIVMADDKVGEPGKEVQNGFKDWFEVAIGNESNAQCGELSYSLQTKDGEVLKTTDKAEVINNKYLQINLKSEYETSVWLTATSRGGKSARRELKIASKTKGPEDKTIKAPPP